MVLQTQEVNNSYNYMAGSAREQDEVNPGPRLATRAVKIFIQQYIIYPQQYIFILQTLQFTTSIGGKRFQFVLFYFTLFYFILFYFVLF